MIKIIFGKIFLIAWSISVLFFSCSQPKETRTLKIDLYKIESVENIANQLNCCGAIADSAFLKLNTLDPSLSLIEIYQKRKEITKSDDRVIKNLSFFDKLKGSYNEYGVRKFYAPAIIGLADNSDTTFVNAWLKGKECEICFPNKIKFKWIAYSGMKESSILVALKEEKPSLSLDSSAVDSFSFARTNVRDDDGLPLHDDKGNEEKYYSLKISLKKNTCDKIQKIMRSDFRASFFYYSPDSLLRMANPSEKSHGWNKIGLKIFMPYLESEVKIFQENFGKKVFVRDL